LIPQFDDFPSDFPWLGTGAQPVAWRMGIKGSSQRLGEEMGDLSLDWFKGNF